MITLETTTCIVQRGRVVGRYLVAFRRLAYRTLRFAPVSVSLMVLSWGLYFWRHHLGIEVPLRSGELVSALTSGLTAQVLSGLVVSTICFLLFATPAERTLGSLRFSAVAIFMQCVGVPLGLRVAQAMEFSGMNRWGADLTAGVYLSPLGWIWGVCAFASVRMPLRWGRRIRLVLVAVSATLALYSGTLLDVVAFSCALFGIIAGQAIYHRPRRFRWPHISPREVRVLVVTLLLSAAAGPILAALNPLSAGPFSLATRAFWESLNNADEVHVICSLARVSIECRHALALDQQRGIGAALANLMPQFLQLIIALGLLKGRRSAWWAAVAAQILVMGVLCYRLATDGRPDALWVVNFVLILLPWMVTLGTLIACRRHFQAPSFGKTRFAVQTTAVVGLCSLAWCGGVMLMREQFYEPVDLRTSLWELPNRFLPPALSEPSNYYLIPRGSLGWFLYDWIGVVLWTLIGVCAVQALGHSAPQHGATVDKARVILTNGSGDHLSFMTLWEGTSYFFSKDNRGYVAYRLWRGIAVTIGQPVVSTGTSIVDVAKEFEDHAVAQGWRVAWYSVTESFVNTRTGNARLKVAEEAILPITEEKLQFRGKKFQNVRTARNNATRAGITSVWTTWDELDVSTRDSILDVSEEWVSEKTLPEMRFTLGTVEELPVEGTKLLLAVDTNGLVHGVTSWIPVYTEGTIEGYVLDVMRRSPEGFKAVVDFLISEMLLVAAREGLDWISLSGAPLAGQPEKPGVAAGVLQRLGNTMEPLYGFRALAASKARFQPDHIGWYLSYDDGVALPAIGMAISHAYLPHLRPRDAWEALRIWRGSQSPKPVANQPPRHNEREHLTPAAAPTRGS